MINYKIGSKVKVIDDNTSGIITQINGNEVTIESEDGFDETYYMHEILPDVGMEDEIEDVEEPIEQTKPKKSTIKEEPIIEEPTIEEIKMKEALKKLVDENLAQNSAEFQQKLEERYKKEIKVSKKKKGTFVLDLHYGRLENYSAQLPTHHILKRQLNAAVNGIEKARNQGYKKIILVHGKGKGVLESEIKKYLDLEGYVHYDADFRQYKLGATEVEL